MRDEIKCLAGVEIPAAIPWEPFAAPVLEFLDQLSAAIRKESKENRLYEEIAAFGFWCRRSNLNAFRNRYEDGRIRLGRGLIFHIPATNVPVLFAYSLVIGLLAGNGCVVRISGRSQTQDLKLCDIMGALLNRNEHRTIKERISVFTCSRDDDRVRMWLEQCDGTVIWGGDETITSIRCMPMKPDAVQVMFPDRYSICILDVEHMKKIQEETFKELAHRFYRDTYAMDQNACSCPRFVLWNPGKNALQTSLIQKKWWKAVAEAASDYEITAYKATSKYEFLCSIAMLLDEAVGIECYENLLYTIMLSKIPGNVEQLRGNCGIFFEYAGNWRSILSQLAVRQLQTVTYYGLEKQDLTDYVVQHHLYGIHRVVPVGRAMDMDLIWDGQDLITMLSRQISQEG